MVWIMAACSVVLCRWMPAPRPVFELAAVTQFFL
jgi:hypothetical protein